MKTKKILGFKINKPQVIGLVVALIIILLSYIFLRDSDIFYFLLGISFLIGGFPFFVSLILETSATREIDEMFLEFSRDLVESVKAGTPISKSILNIREKDYGKLSPYIDKLANQISLGISIQTAFQTFARDVGTITIDRAVTIIGESEKAGGEIADILDSVVKSVSQVDRLKKERRATMYTLIVQGYIIFFIFIVIMLVMEFKILPIAAGLGEGIGEINPQELGGFGGFIGGGQRATSEELSRPFIWLLVVQGFFAGLVIGKLSEGKVRSGLKHSFILIIFSLLIDASAKIVFGGVGG